MGKVAALLPEPATIARLLQEEGDMKLEDLSLRQVAIAVPILGLFNWAGLQYVVLPHMPEGRRRQLYAGAASSPYLYAVSLAFVVFAAWFVFKYQGRFATHGRRVAVFGMALGSLCGTIMIIAIRAYWHI
jgi:hypothetical protein